MKRLVLAALLVLATCASLPAQQTSFLIASPAKSVSFSVDSLAFGPAAPAPTLDGANFHFAPPAAPAPAALPEAPRPQGPGARDDYTRWDLAIGFEYAHFKSNLYSANLFGLHSALGYNLNDWFGVEGSLVAAFGGDVFSGAKTRYVLFTGGPRITWRPLRKRWEPWAHALVGGLHMEPQTANNGKNGFAFQVGGGADLRFNPRLSFRVEGDYVRSMLYGGSQNNIQAGAGAVFHF